jgi:hypothetical protein
LGSSENSGRCPREPLQEDGSASAARQNEQTTMADQRRQPARSHRPPGGPGEVLGNCR